MPPDIRSRPASEFIRSLTNEPVTCAFWLLAAAGPDRWSVTGRVIHGRPRTITFPVTRVTGRYRGRVAIKQRDFGIEPIKVAGGTVPVKDELTVEFDVGR